MGVVRWVTEEDRRKKRREGVYAAIFFFAIGLPFGIAGAWGIFIGASVLAAIALWDGFRWT
jgi:hypothetical protein